MPDIAELGFEAETRDLVRAQKELHGVERSAEKTERASDKLGKQMNETNRASGLMMQGFKKLRASLILAASAAAALGVAFAGMSLRRFISSTVEADAVQAQLAAAIKSTGGVAGQTVNELNKHAAALQKITNYGDETTNQAQALLLTFTKIQGDTFPRATSAVLDMATAMKTDLKSAAIQVGKALNDPVLGATALSRSGIQFSESQKKVIKSLVETGQQAKAQEIILKELETQFKGSAKAARETLGGALTSVANAWGDLFELGKSATEPLRAALERMITVIQNPAFVSFVQTIGTVLVGSFAALINVTSSFIEQIIVLSPVLKEIGIALLIAFGPSVVMSIGALAIAIGTSLVGAIYSAAAAMVAFTLSNPFTAIAYAVPIVLAAIYLFRDEIKQVMGIDVVAYAKDAANGIIASLVGAYNGIIATFRQLPGAMGDLAYQAANQVIYAMKDMARQAIMLINDMVGAINKTFNLSIEGPRTSLIKNGGIDNPFAGQASQVGAAFSAEMQKAFATDWVGNFGNAVSSATGELTNAIGPANDLANSMNNLGNAAAGEGGATGGSGKSGGGAAQKLSELQRIAKDFGKLSEPFNQAQSAFNAAKQALDNGIITNDQYANSLSRIEAAFMRAGGSAEQWAKIVGENTDTVASKMKDLAENSLNRLGDEFINLAVEGKANFADLAKSIVKDLLKIAWQALVVKPLLGWFSGLGIGGAASGAAFDPWGGLRAAKGAAFFANGGTFTNSVVNKPTPFTFANGGALGVMGEAGPEAIMPLQRGPDGSLGVQMYGGASNGRSQNINNEVKVDNHYMIEGAVSEDKVISQIKQSGEQTKDDVKRQLVGWLNQYQRDGTMS